MIKKQRVRIVFNSPAILSFVAISVFALLMNSLTSGESNRIVFSIWHSSLANPLTYIRFFTHVFGHSTWQHFSGNMVYILLLGPLLEEKYKSIKILEVVLVTALVTGLINYILFPSVSLCGASGVCFAFMLLSSFTSFKEKEIPVTFILVAVFFLGQQFVDGILLQDNISNTSHIVGGIIGANFGFLGTKRKSS